MVVGHGHIPGLVCLDGKGKPYQLGGIHVDIGGFGVEDELLLLAEQFHQILRLLLGCNKPVIVCYRFGRVFVAEGQQVVGAALLMEEVEVA